MDRAQVLALAPDASSARAAQGIRSWISTGATPAALWGECRGSGAAPYATAVDLTGPGYTCSCPSRKIPCKHALALMLLYADEAIPEKDEPPEWVTAWLRQRAAKATRPAGGEPADPEAARRRADQRAERVASGLRELDQWLRDQVSAGLAAAAQAGYRHWDTIAARMVDAQCPAVAERLRGLSAAPYSGTGWEGRLLEELAMLRLLATAYRRRDTLPQGLTDAMRSRIGFTIRRAEVLATAEPVADVWDVLGWRDLQQERISTRRIWLRGRDTGRPALVLSFAPLGEQLDASLVPGTAVQAELAFYPAAIPLRAVVAHRAGTSTSPRVPEGVSVNSLLDEVADAMGKDPWLESWPTVLAGIIPALRPVPCLAHLEGQALPLHPDADPWPLLAVSAGRPATLAAEWTPRGLWPLTAWAADGPPAPL